MAWEEVESVVVRVSRAAVYLPVKKPPARLWMSVNLLLTKAQVQRRGENLELTDCRLQYLDHIVCKLLRAQVQLTLL